MVEAAGVEPSRSVNNDGHLSSRVDGHMPRGSGRILWIPLSVAAAWQQNELPRTPDSGRWLTSLSQLFTRRRRPAATAAVVSTRPGVTRGSHGQLRWLRACKRDPEEKASAVPTVIEQLTSLERWITARLADEMTRPPL